MQTQKRKNHRLQVSTENSPELAALCVFSEAAGIVCSRGPVCLLTVSWNRTERPADPTEAE